MPGTQTKQATERKTKRPVPWNVVLLDDDAHSYDYVIQMMQELFAHPLERAFQLAQKVDSEGRVVCKTTHKELAELKREQIHSFGRDALIAGCKGAMSAIIEPAEFDGQDDADL